MPVTLEDSIISHKKSSWDAKNFQWRRKTSLRRKLLKKSHHPQRQSHRQPPPLPRLPPAHLPAALRKTPERTSSLATTLTSIWVARVQGIDGDHIGITDGACGIDQDHTGIEEAMAKDGITDGIGEAGVSDAIFSYSIGD